MTDEPSNPPKPAPPEQGAPEPSSWMAPMRYPNIYVWYVLLSALDIMLTALIMAAGGSEINSVADRIMGFWGLPGLTAFKFAVVILVVSICEIVGRKNDRTGRRLAEWAVAITAIPVVVSLVQLLVLVHHYGVDQPLPGE